MTATGRSEPSVMLPALRIVLHAGALCEAACYSDNASPLVWFCRFDGSREQCLRARGWPGNRVAEEDARPRPKMLPPQIRLIPGKDCNSDMSRRICVSGLLQGDVTTSSINSCMRSPTCLRMAERRRN
jgi:hypothetical protein